MQFLPRQFHVEVLRNFGQALANRRTLILVERLWTSGEKGAHRDDRLANALDRLMAEGITAPEDTTVFLLRLDRALNGQRMRITDCVSDLHRSLAEAGFRLKELSDAQGRRIVSFPGGGLITIKIVAAFPMKHRFGAT